MMIVNRYLKFSTKEILIIIVVVATILHWIILEVQLPIFTQLPGWFWKFISKPTGPVWIIALLMAISLITPSILTTTRKYKTKLLLLLFIGTSLQFGFAFLEERGVDAIKDRIVYTGHAEFATIAVQHDNVFYLASHYEFLLKSGKLGQYAKTKPPGTLLFYMLTKKIAKFYLTSKNKNEEDQLLEKLRNIASFFWPLISYMVLIPMYYFAAMLFGKDTAILSCTLYLFVPSVNLITLHTDQVIYPFLFMMSILMAAMAAKKNNFLLALCAGVFIYFSIWFTFTLVLVLPFVISSCYFLPSRNDHKLKYIPFLKVLLCIVVGVLIADIFFRFLFNYDVLLRYKNAINYHVGWKNWNEGFILTIYYAILNLIEYFVWVGIPLFILSIMAFKRSILKFSIERKLTLSSMQPIILFGTLLMLSLLGKTKGEVARLWLFFVPYMCIVTADLILTEFNYRNQWFIRLIVLLQFGTTYFTKVNQDFY